MNLSRLLAARAAADRPITVGVIGAGKFGAMFLAMAARSPGIHVAIIADLSPAKARENLTRIGWSAEQSAAAIPPREHLVPGPRSWDLKLCGSRSNDPWIEVAWEIRTAR